MNTLTNTIEKITLITGSGTLAFMIAFVLMPYFIKLLIKYKLGKQIRDTAMSGEKSSLFTALHLFKTGTPTMGGVLIWSTILAVVLFSRFLSATGVIDHSLLNRKETWIPLFTLLSFGVLGMVDDYLNVKGIGKTKGISAGLKFILLLILALCGGLWFYFKLDYTTLLIPIPGIPAIELGWLFIPLFVLVIVASANAVNFTDGLDGLAGGLLIMAFGAFGILSYVDGLFILSALCAVICGAVLAFLWFNVPPAKLYMGDTGAISLGATLGVIAMLSHQTLVLPIVGFIFVIEALSVIIQLTSKKFFKRKVFKIAPIHHHFEQCGWKEFTVTMRFWIIGGIMAVFGTILGLINIASA